MYHVSKQQIGCELSLSHHFMFSSKQTFTSIVWCGLQTSGQLNPAHVDC